MAPCLLFAYLAPSDKRSLKGANSLFLGKTLFQKGGSTVLTELP